MDHIVPMLCIFIIEETIEEGNILLLMDDVAWLVTWS